MTNQSETLIPLNKLKKAKTNVRNKKTTLSIDELTASIVNLGLIHALTVAPDKRKGHHGVYVGGRRLDALNNAVEKGLLPPDYEVRVIINDVSEEQQRTISLAENIDRLDMTPSEEIEAFSNLFKDGKSPEEIAATFGISQATVERRLRLTQLATPILKALKEGKISLQVATAFAATADQARQLHVWKKLHIESMHQHNVKNEILHGTIPSTSAIARLVGEEAYKAAGGAIELDLFSDDQDQIWSHPEIAYELAEKVIEERIVKIKEDESLDWVEFFNERHMAVNKTFSLSDTYLTMSDPDGEDLEKCAILDEQIDTLREQYSNSEDQQECLELQRQIKSLSEQYEKITSQAKYIDPYYHGSIGKLLYLNDDGELLTLPHIYSTKKKPAHSKTTTASEPNGDNQNTEPQKPSLSAALTADLAKERRDVLQLHIANNPQFALDALIFQLALPYASTSTFYGWNGIDLKVDKPNQPDPESPTLSAIQAQILEIKNNLNFTWFVANNEAESFNNFLLLSDEEKASLIAYIFSTTISPSLNNGPADLRTTFGQLLNIDIKQFWRPNASNFFSRIKRAQTLSILEEVGGPTFASAYSKAKSSELAASAEKIFSGEAIIDNGIKEKALAWSPEEMTFDVQHTIDETQSDLNTADEQTDTPDPAN